MKKQSKRAVPAFASEAEEAAWWYENRKSHDKEFAAAVENGEAQVLTGQKLRERIEASKAKIPAQMIYIGVPGGTAGGWGSRVGSGGQESDGDDPDSARSRSSWGTGSAACTGGRTRIW